NGYSTREPCLPRLGARFLDQSCIDLEADGLGAVLLGGSNDDAPIATAQVIEQVAGLDLRQLQHGVHDFRWRGHEVNVGLHMCDCRLRLGMRTLSRKRRKWDNIIAPACTAGRDRPAPCPCTSRSPGPGPCRTRPCSALGAAWNGPARPRPCMPTGPGPCCPGRATHNEAFPGG